jgi:hypothetical protein
MKTRSARNSPSAIVVALQLPKIELNRNANVRLMESAVNLSASNRFRVLTGSVQCYTAVAAMVAASALMSPALATFQRKNSWHKSLI